MIVSDKNIKHHKSIDYILEKFAYRHPYIFFYFIFVGMPMCVLIAVIIEMYIVSSASFFVSNIIN